jgi:hypothetical protein
MAAHKPGYFLDASPNLHALRVETQRLANAQQAWEKVAPPALVSASRVGVFQHGALMVYVGNGAIAAKLKQQAPRLLGKLQERGLEVTAIRFEVQVSAPDAEMKPQKNLVLGQGALDSLEQLADGLEDSPLKDTLRRLLRHHSNGHGNHRPE